MPKLQTAVWGLVQAAERKKENQISADSASSACPMELSFGCYSIGARDKKEGFRNDLQAP